MKIEFDIFPFLISFFILSLVGFIAGILILLISGNVEIFILFILVGQSLGLVSGLFSAIGIKSITDQKGDEK